MIRLCKQALTRQDTYLYPVIVMTYASAEIDDQIQRLTTLRWNWDWDWDGYRPESGRTIKKCFCLFNSAEISEGGR